MATYNIRHTQIGKPPIQVDETAINTDFDAIFPGRIRLEWGEEINANLLRLLERFSSPEDVSNVGNPDLDQTTNDLLSNPVTGQLWYNSTQKRLYSYNGNAWVPYTLTTQDYAANWGQLEHGEILPQPVSSSGYVFNYNECIWSTSIFHIRNRFRFPKCYTSVIEFAGLPSVHMTYRTISSSVEVPGIANYLIIGIKSNVDLGTKLF